mgnify:FL=1
MIKIDNLKLSKENKDILSEYKIELTAIKLKKIDTTVESYIEDIYKYLEYIEEKKHINSALNIKEEDIISWVRYNNLNFLDCACNVTKKSLGKRLEMKNLIKDLRKINKNVDINILNSSKNINIDAVLGYTRKNLKYNFLDDYEERNIFDE